jgi:hypothetical protein
MLQPTTLARHGGGSKARVDLGEFRLPPQPTTVEETGLDFGFLLDLALKTVYFAGTPSAAEVGDKMALPFVVVEELLRFLRRQEYVGVTGTTGLSAQDYRYSITSKGVVKAQEVLDINQYAGPAPIPLAQYIAMVKRQSIRDINLTAGDLTEGMNGLVLEDETLSRVGIALGSGRSILLYGESGNGKSTIAARIRDLLPGRVLVPHAIEAYGQVIRVYDPRVHVESLPEAIPSFLAAAETDVTPFRSTKWDRRWVPCGRPVVATGGGLKLEDLELGFSPHTNYYVAPVQMKAMNGVLLVDDFGRQLVRPEALLNRWIVPLEDGVDHLALHSGPMVEIPFDVMLIFATNLMPSDLGDEGFFRRIRHKVRIGNPSEASFRKILSGAAARANIPYTDAGGDYLIERYYRPTNRPFRGVHPRDLCDLMNDIGKYREEQPDFTPKWIDLAAASYFVTD